MGIYLNPGNRGFQTALKSQIYVDMTGLIVYTNKMLGTNRKYICVSRPRRFGKTMAASMLSAYYSEGCDSRQMFEGLEISQDPGFEKYLNKYSVIYINVQDFYSRKHSTAEMLNFLQRSVLKDLISEYQDIDYIDESDLVSVLKDIYNYNHTPFIFILDEWDCIFREDKENISTQKQYLDFLRNLLKDKDYVELAYMTGILPVKKYGTHSALNMFDEYSMTSPGKLARFIGFSELKVKKLCEDYRVDFTEMQRWYDGYLFDDDLHIYSPKSVVDAVFFGKFSNYWTRTETYEALKIYIDMNFDGMKDAVIRMLAGDRCQINPEKFQNDMTTFQSRDDVLTLLVHLGYLAYDEETREVFIPNREVEIEFKNAVEGAGWSEVAKALTDSENLLRATLQGDADVVAEKIEAVHNDTSSILTYNRENDLACVIAIAYYSARASYTFVREMPSGKGFADMVLLPRKNATDKPAMVIELKWDSSVQGAIEQIKERKYGNILKDYTGNLLMVGINYSKGNKKHQCLIEKCSINSNENCNSLPVFPGM